jgi:Fe2+ transport system protein B
MFGRTWWPSCKKQAPSSSAFPSSFWLLSYFPTGVAAESYLALFGQAIEPLGQTMGLPWQS